MFSEVHSTKEREGKLNGQDQGSRAVGDEVGWVGLVAVLDHEDRDASASVISPQAWQASHGPQMMLITGPLMLLGLRQAWCPSHKASKRPPWCPTPAAASGLHPAISSVGRGAHEPPSVGRQPTCCLIVQSWPGRARASRCRHHTPDDCNHPLPSKGPPYTSFLDVK